MIIVVLLLAVAVVALGLRLHAVERRLTALEALQSNTRPSPDGGSIDNGHVDQV